MTTLVRGMLNLDDLRRRVQAGEIDTVLVAATDHIGRLIGKRFDAEFFLESVHDHGTHGCDYLLTVDMEMTPVPGFRYANWELGYGDFHMTPDLSTLRTAAWLERSALVLCDIRSEKTHDYVHVAPRTILRRQIERAQALGYEVMAASELEYYLFEDTYRAAAEKGYAGLKPAAWYLEDYHMLQGAREEKYTGAVRRALAASGVPVENSKGEFGYGQHEVNVRYADALTMADRHVVYKQCLKEVAEQQGVSVTFMAKPFSPPQAGSSCHIHLSLWKDGKNAFAGEQTIGPVRGSDEFRWFLAGWMAHTHDVMPFYAPTINSYKRYEDGSWAPTRIAWSYDNRTAGFRVAASPARTATRIWLSPRRWPRGWTASSSASSRRRFSRATCIRRGRCRACRTRSARRRMRSPPARSRPRRSAPTSSNITHTPRGSSSRSSTLR